MLRPPHIARDDEVDARVAHQRGRDVRSEEAGASGHQHASRHDAVTDAASAGIRRRGILLAGHGRDAMHRPSVEPVRRLVCNGPEGCHDQAGDDVPDAPPAGDDRHAAEAAEEREDQPEPQAGIADADLERHRLALARAEAADDGCAVADREGDGVVDRDDHEDDAEEGDEVRPVAGERGDDEADQREQREPLHEWLHLRREPREAGADREARQERQADDQEDVQQHLQGFSSTAVSRVRAVGCSDPRRRPRAGARRCR